MKQLEKQELAIEELEKRRWKETLGDEMRELHYLELKQANRELLEHDTSAANQDAADKCEPTLFSLSRAHSRNHPPTNEHAQPTECIAYALGRHHLEQYLREGLTLPTPEAKAAARVMRANLKRLREKAEEACEHHQKVRRSSSMDVGLLATTIPLLSDVFETEGAESGRDQSAHFARKSS